MRYLLSILLLTAPLLAQEAGEQAPAEPDKADEIRKLVETFLDTHKDGEKLEAIEKRLRTLLEGQDLKLEITPMVTGRDLRIFLDGVPRGGLETICGSTNGASYTLKSLGGGRYELTATQKTDDGGTKEIKDRGTLKELRKKHAFLHGMYAIGVPRLAGGGGGGLHAFHEPSRARLGALVRSPGETLSHHLELPTGAGLVVVSVAKDSRAEALGLKEHDVLLRIDGELIDSPDQLEKLERGAGVLEYLRRGKLRKLDLATVAVGEK